MDAERYEVSKALPSASWHHRPFVGLGLVLATMALLASAASAAVVETDKLTASDAAPSDYFGYGVSLDGDTLAIAAGGGGNDGAVYLFELAPDGLGYIETQKLTPSDSGVNFGYGDLDLADGVLAVGAPGPSPAVYVFEQVGGLFIETQKLVNDGSSFGGAIAVSSDRIVIGESNGFTNVGHTGAAWLYERSGGAFTALGILAPSDLDVGDFYGAGVAIEGDTIVIGTSAGADAYVFEPDAGGTFNEIVRLTASDGTGDTGFFGRTVALSGDTVVVGAFSQNAGGLADSGAAYVYERAGVSYVETAKLVASDAAEFDLFSESVDIFGDQIVVGAPGNDEQDRNAGAAYVFQRSGLSFIESAKLTASDPAEGASFGAVVTISTDAISVSAPWDRQAGASAGAVYAFQPAPISICSGLVVTVDLALGETPTSGDDVIRGTSGPDVIDALAGDDVICGLQGNDTINAGDGFDKVFGGLGYDTINGGAGNDRLVGGLGNDRIDGGNGNDRIQGGPGFDVLYGGNGLDRIAGNDGTDYLYGGDSNDRLFGNLGRDYLFGEAGDDVLRGGAWRDDMDGGPGSDDGCTLNDPAGLVEVRVDCEGGVFGR